jgi:hypothetical protein
MQFSDADMEAARRWFTDYIGSVSPEDTGRIRSLATAFAYARVQGVQHGKAEERRAIVEGSGLFDRSMTPPIVEQTPKELILRRMADTIWSWADQFKDNRRIFTSLRDFATLLHNAAAGLR